MREPRYKRADIVGPTHRRPWRSQVHRDRRKRVGDGVEVRAAYLVSPLDDFKTHTISQIIGSIIAESRFRHDQVRG